MTTNIVVAAIQMCSGPEVENNLSQAEVLMRKAAEAGADWVVLPENFAALDAPRDVLAQAAPGIVEWLSSQARRWGMGVVGGSVALPDRPDGAPVSHDRFRSACLVMDSQGALIARYDKVHLFDAQVADGRGGYRESALYEPGDGPVTVRHRGWRLQPIICYDLRFPEILRQDRTPPDWVAVPAAFTAVTGARHWSLLVRTRAVENQCYVVAANQGGRHPSGRETWGHSMIAGPDGEVLAEQVVASEEGAVVLSRLARAHLHAVREAMPVAVHRRYGMLAADQ
ncbi:MAG: carbon-nitrogen hydrolase family protein [Gammaproteobacteria bacterium]|nr:MAG: carbon-nitrogen hydrolase family protein [Gammaproteobacteria bacterium]